MVFKLENIRKYFLKALKMAIIVKKLIKFVEIC